MSTPLIKVPSTGTEKRALDIAIDTMNSAQQAVPVPLLRGMRKVSVTIISTIYAPHTRKTPKDATSKK